MNIQHGIILLQIFPNFFFAWINKQTPRWWTEEMDNITTEDDIVERLSWKYREQRPLRPTTGLQTIADSSSTRQQHTNRAVLREYSSLKVISLVCDLSNQLPVWSSRDVEYLAALMNTCTHMCRVTQCSWKKSTLGVIEHCQ